jgi:hypothetical protein
MTAIERCVVPGYRTKTLGIFQLGFTVTKSSPPKRYESTAEGPAHRTSTSNGCDALNAYPLEFENPLTTAPLTLTGSA